MQYRDHEAVKKMGKRDLHEAKPHLLKVDPAYNVRDMEDPETIAHVRWLADSIKESGVQVPLEVRVSGEDVYVVAGHCRLAAALLAISEGHEIKTVPTILEKKYTNDADRVANLVISNSGKSLTPLAVAEVVRRLLAFGWDKEKIAARLGWKSAANVEHYTTILGADSDVHQMIRSGAVAASTAAKVVKKEGSKAGATLKAAAAASKSGEKITAKTIRASKGEFDPTPKNIAVLVKFVQDVAHGNSSLKKAAETIVKSLGLAA
jgi:ParB-like chromosome segregation protein Spo0J